MTGCNVEAGDGTLWCKKSSIAIVPPEKEKCVFNKHKNRRELKCLLPRQSLNFFGDRIWQEVREDASAACLSGSLASYS